MTNVIQIIWPLLNKSYSPYLFIWLVITAIYYKFFLFGKIPFPGDLLVVSYSPWLDYYKFPVQNPLISDVFSQFFLWKNLAIESFKNWQWPLWNPYSFTGTPLLATYHSAMLYPLNILLLLPKHFGWGLYIYSQTLIASATFYLFISQIIKSKIASFAGAITFSLGGLMATWLELGTAVHAMAWLPLALYSVNRFFLLQKFRFIIILTTSLSLIILSGNAQVTTYSFIIVSLYSLWLCWRGKIFTPIYYLIFALLLSVCITALQLLPSAELLQNSIRQTESYASEANFGLLKIKDVFKFFIPDYFGNEVTRNYWGTLNYSETSGFLGVMSIFLLLYVFLKIRSKDTLFFLMLFLFSLLFAFDNYISHAFYSMKIPLLTSSYASRILFITLLSSSVLSAMAINHILDNKNLIFFQKTILWSWSAVVGIFIGTLLTYYFIQNIISSAPNKQYLQVYLSSRDYTLSNFLIAAKNSLVPLALLTVLLFLSTMLNIIKSKFLRQYRLNILLSIILILLILDLGRYFLKFNPFVSQDIIFPSVPALKFLQDQPKIFRVGREHAEILPPNTWTAYHIQSIEGYDPIYLGQYGEFINFLNGGDIRTGNTNRYAELLNYQSPFLDTANVKYFIGIGRDPSGHIPGNFINYKLEEAGYKRIFKDGSAIILENPNALERVYLAKNVVTLSTKKIKDKFMTDKLFDPRNTTILSKNLDISSVTGNGKVEIVGYSPNIVKLKTETLSDEVLVLADQYEKGWKATIDGKASDISPANLIFRAVKVPAGAHEVVFSYYPKSFDKGLKISLASLLLIFIISYFTIRTQRF